MTANLGHGTYKVYWTEPTGSVCVLNINFQKRWLHGMFSMPSWLAGTPEISVCHQNEYLPKMREYRDKGAQHPMMVNWDFAEITYMKDCGRDNDDVIACAPSELPEGYLDRRN